MIQEEMNADPVFALGISQIMEHSGCKTLAAWAEHSPRLAVALAEQTCESQDTDFVRAVDTHGSAQRGLAEAAGYTRDVWHRPPGDPVE